MSSTAIRSAAASGFTFDAGMAFVAGGSGGLGAAIVRAFAEAGCDVFFTYNRNKAGAEAAQAEAGAFGRRIDFAQLSLEDSAAVHAAMASVREQMGPIHSVVYAAGPPPPIEFVGGISEEIWHKTFQLDTHAPASISPMPRSRSSRNSAPDQLRQSRAPRAPGICPRASCLPHRRRPSKV